MTGMELLNQLDIVLLDLADKVEDEENAEAKQRLMTSQRTLVDAYNRLLEHEMNQAITINEADFNTTLEVGEAIREAKEANKILGFVASLVGRLVAVV